MNAGRSRMILVEGTDVTVGYGFGPRRRQYNQESDNRDGRAEPARVQSTDRRERRA